jgi:hypothetical protein
MTLLLAGGLIGSTLRDLVRLAGPGGGKSLGPAINLGVGDGWQGAWPVPLGRHSLAGLIPTDAGLVLTVGLVAGVVATRFPSLVSTVTLLARAEDKLGFAMPDLATEEPS